MLVMLLLLTLLTAVGVRPTAQLLLVVCKTQEAAQRGATATEVRNAALQCRDRPNVLINQRAILVTLIVDRSSQAIPGFLRIFVSGGSFFSNWGVEGTICWDP